MKSERPSGEDMLTDKERWQRRFDEDESDEPEPDNRESCQCPFCHCSVKTSFGICDMCSQGAHQG